MTGDREAMPGGMSIGAVFHCRSALPGVRRCSSSWFSSPLTCEVSLKPPQKWLIFSRMRKRNGAEGGSESA